MGIIIFNLMTTVSHDSNLVYNVQTKSNRDNTDVTLLHTIAVDYPVTGYTSTYWWQELLTYSEKFVTKVNSFSNSNSITGGYGNVTAEASFAYETASTRTTKRTLDTKNMQASSKKYPVGQYQVWRRVRETVAFNGVGSIKETLRPYNVVTEVQSPEFYRILANNYLKNVLLPADVEDDKVHNQGATVYTTRGYIKGIKVKDH